MLAQILRQMNGPLLAAVAAVYAAALALVAWLRAGRGEALAAINDSGRGWRRAVIAATAAYFVVYALLSMERYYKLLDGAWDLGIFDSLFYNALKGRVFVDYRGPFDHFQPIYLLFVPFYALWQDARFLLVLQTAALAAAAWPLYLLASEVSGRKAVGAAVAIVYLLYPLVGEANLYDVHMLSFSPVCFFTMLLFMVRRKWKWYWAFMVLTLSTKESEAVIVFSAGVYLLFSREYRRGAITAAAAAAWFFGATAYVLPAVTGAPFRHFGRYASLTDVAEWAYGSGIGRATALAYLARVFAVGVFTLAPLSFLPMRRWRAFAIIFGPAFVINMISRNPYQNVIFGHYGTTVSSAALAACALATGGPGATLGEKRHSAAPVFLVAVAFLSNVVLSFPANETFIFPKAHLDMAKSFNVMSMPIPFTSARLHFYRQGARERLFFALRDAIPAGSSVAAENNLGPHFMNRYCFSDISEKGRADYYVFDNTAPCGVVNPKEREAVYRDLTTDPAYVCAVDLRSAAAAGIVVFARRELLPAVYANLKKARERNPGDEGPRLALAAIDQTLEAAPRPPGESGSASAGGQRTGETE